MRKAARSALLIGLTFLLAVVAVSAKWRGLETKLAVRSAEGSNRGAEVNCVINIGSENIRPICVTPNNCEPLFFHDILCFIRAESNRSKLKIRSSTYYYIGNIDRLERFGEVLAIGYGPFEIMDGRPSFHFGSSGRTIIMEGGYETIDGWFSINKVCGEGNFPNERNYSLQLLSHVSLGIISDSILPIDEITANRCCYDEEKCKYSDGACPTHHVIIAPFLSYPSLANIFGIFSVLAGFLLSAWEIRHFVYSEAQYSLIAGAARFIAAVALIEVGLWAIFG
jgi:hypothetical protein